MNVLKKIPFIGIIFLVIVPYVFSNVLTSNEYSKRGDNEPYIDNLKWDDRDKYHLERYINPVIKIGDKSIKKSKIIENLYKKIKNGAIDIVDKMLQREYDLKFIAGVVSVLQSKGSVGKFQNFVEKEKYGNDDNNDDDDDDDDDDLENMNYLYQYKDYYSGNYIYYDVKGIDYTIGICCAKWLASKSTDNTNFGFGIAYWRDPDRINGLLDEYYNYINDDDCKIENNKCTPLNESKNKICKADCYEIESKYFMKELEGDFQYIYNNWKTGKMNSKNGNYDNYSRPEPSDAAMYFCMEFYENASHSSCNERRGSADIIYQIMINGNENEKEKNVKTLVTSLLKSEEKTGKKGSCDAYVDSKGYPTIGWGKRCYGGENHDEEVVIKITDQNEADEKAKEICKYLIKDCTPSVALQWLSDDIDKTLEYIQTYDNIKAAYDKASNKRKAVLISMAYQMGCDGLSGFKDFLKSMAEGYYVKASEQMLDSKWAVKDSPNRAIRHAYIIEHNKCGDFCNDYNW